MQLNAIAHDGHYVNVPTKEKIMGLIYKLRQPNDAGALADFAFGGLLDKRAPARLRAFAAERSIRHTRGQKFLKRSNRFPELPSSHSGGKTAV